MSDPQGNVRARELFTFGLLRSCSLVIVAARSNLDDRAQDMGRTYLFECPHCGYSAKVSGGADKGLRFNNQTLLCQDCKQLYDVITAVKAPVKFPMTEPLIRKRLRPTSESRPPKLPKRPPLFAVALNSLLPAGSKHFKWMMFKPACPVSPLHRARAWRQPDRCPKCGVLMERNGLPYRLWD